MNMAIDEALLRLASGPVLRLYTWFSPTLSIGCHQKLNPEIISRCAEKKVGLVRRPSGGRAVLHCNELTYAVISPYECFNSGPALKDIYEAISLWHIKALEKIGIKAAVSGCRHGGRHYAGRDSCFDSSTPYELTVGGRKIAGSAQKRGRSAFIQHGSILIDMDHNLYSALMGGGHFSYTTLRSEGYRGTYEELANLMTETFASYFSVKLLESGLSKEEQILASDLKVALSLP